MTPGRPGRRGRSWVLLFGLGFGMGAGAAASVPAAEQPRADPALVAREDGTRVLAAKVAALEWTRRPEARPVAPNVLAQSLGLAKKFMLASQTPAGNFTYTYDALNDKAGTSDNAVRQAGALWGLALLYQAKPDPALQLALERGFSYFQGCSVPGPDGASRAIVYGKNPEAGTGVVALVGLALVDYLRSHPRIKLAQRRDLEVMLDRYLAFLVEMQIPSGHFSGKWDSNSGERDPEVNPYYNGEALLCLARAAKYLGRQALVPVVSRAGTAFLRDLIVPLAVDEQAPVAIRQYYQWVSMAFWEIQDAGWDQAEAYRDALLLTAHWMIHVRKIGHTEVNVGHAVEGLVPALRVARARELPDAVSDLAGTVHGLVGQVLSFQVGGPLAPERQSRKDALIAHDPRAAGGFQSRRNDSELRIDFTQHSLHALLQAGKSQ